jgi:hypothetical protein
VTGALDAGDAGVEIGDPRRQRVDRCHRGLQALGDADLQRIDLIRRRAKARRQVADAGQRHLPRRRILRLVGDVDEGVEHLLRRVAEAGLAGLEDLLELLQLIAAGAVGSRQRLGQRRFAGQEVAVRAAHGGDVDALAEKAAAGLLAGRRGELDLLARVAGRVGVGDVVAGDLQRRVVRGHRPRAEAQK